MTTGRRVSCDDVRGLRSSFLRAVLALDGRTACVPFDRVEPSPDGPRLFLETAGVEVVILFAFVAASVCIVVNVLELVSLVGLTDFDDVTFVCVCLTFSSRDLDGASTETKLKLETCLKTGTSTAMGLLRGFGLPSLSLSRNSMDNSDSEEAA